MLEPLRLDGLGTHLNERYRIEVAAVTPLDPGVVRVDRRNGSRWVARVFAAERPLVSLEEDAAILRGLERAGFPAERCADPEPVSEFFGQGVLVTDFLEDHGPLRPGLAAAILGALLGRLHTHPAKDLRPGGAWHHLSFAGGPREEIAAAAELLDDHLSHVAVRDLALFDRLRDEVARMDDCHDLPHQVERVTELAKSIAVVARRAFATPLPGQRSPVVGKRGSVHHGAAGTAQSRRRRPA
jgi:hypothetical protein